MMSHVSRLASKPALLRKVQQVEFCQPVPFLKSPFPQTVIASIALVMFVAQRDRPVVRISLPHAHALAKMMDLGRGVAEPKVIAEDAALLCKPG